MAQFTYGGETIDYMVTRGVNSQVVYDPSNSDYIGTDHTFRVSGTVHGVDGASAAAEYARIRHALERPRQRLIYSVEGTTVYESNNKLDLNNGPHPEVISIDQVVGSCSFAVTLVVRTRLWGCKDKGPPNFLSNRWTEEVVIKDEHLSRVTRTGTLIVRQNVAADSAAARGLVTPPPPRRCLPVEANYQLRADGLALAYRLVWEEQEWMPPSPAIKVTEASYTEHCPDGAKRYGMVRVGLVGRPNGDRRALLALAVMIGTRRLQGAGALRVDKPLLVMYTFKEQLNRNAVELTMQTFLLPVVNPIEDRRAAAITVLARHPEIMRLRRKPEEVERMIAEEFRRGAPLRVDGLVGFGAPMPGSDPANVPAMGLRGTLGLEMVAAALNDPCLPAAAAAARGGRAPDPAAVGAAVRAFAGRFFGEGTEAAGTFIALAAAGVVTVVNQLANWPTDDGSGPRVAPSLYTDCRITCRWEHDEHVAQLAPTDTDAESAFVALAAPTRQLVVEWQAERLGGPPSIPPSSLGPNYVLLRRSSQPGEVGTAPDGRTPIHRTAGWMAFGVHDPRKVIEGGALPPWVVDQIEEVRRSQEPGAEQAGRMLAAAAQSAGGVELPGILPWAGQQQG